MKKSFITYLKILVTIILFLIWFIFIQAEFEMVTKPELQTEFPIIHGWGAVCVFGSIILLISISFAIMLISTLRDLRK